MGGDLKMIRNQNVGLMWLTQKSSRIMEENRKINWDPSEKISYALVFIRDSVGHWHFISIPLYDMIII